MMQVTFKLERETKGAFMYREVDSETEEPLEMRDAQIGTIYLRKSALKGHKTPQAIRVQVEFLADM